MLRNVITEITKYFKIKCLLCIVCKKKPNLKNKHTDFETFIRRFIFDFEICFRWDINISLFNICVVFMYLRPFVINV